MPGSFQALPSTPRGRDCLCFSALSVEAKGRHLLPWNFHFKLPLFFSILTDLASFPWAVSKSSWFPQFCRCDVRGTQGERTCTAQESPFSPEFKNKKNTEALPGSVFHFKDTKQANRSWLKLNETLPCCWSWLYSFIYFVSLFLISSWQ